MLEFDINGNMLPFESLSDGTKRMFYIITETGVPDTSYFGSGFYSSGPDIGRILLIEEPELGIHPHQLQLLMDFLKEQSQHKQIIITTHSPQVLDILKNDELNRIIIASHSPEKGTQLRQLTEKEETKAKTYMSETGFLSDYWKYSDLDSN
jgi:predicted ATPase